MNDTLRNAILHKLALTIVYKGFVRTIEPHAYGLGVKGADLLRAYQTDGGSDSGQGAGWKLFLVNEIERASESGLAFDHPRDGYKTGDKAMLDIYAELN